MDPTQFIMAYEATISSAGGDNPTMTKSLIMACEGPVANGYSHLTPSSISSWPQLKAKSFSVYKETRNRSMITSEGSSRKKS